MTKSLVRVKERELPFLRTVGRVDGPLPEHPTLLHNWWVEPIRTQAQAELLPARARKRMQQVLEQYPVRDVILYHEIKKPRQKRDYTWLHNLQAEVVRFLQAHGWTILKVAAIATFVALTWMMWLVLAVVTIGTAALLSDPVLAIVTQDGYVVEVDRWYS